MDFDNIFSIESKLLEPLNTTMSTEDVRINRRVYNGVRSELEKEIGYIINFIIRISNAPEIKEKYRGVFGRLYRSEIMEALDTKIEDIYFRGLDQSIIPFFNIYINVSRIVKNVENIDPHTQLNSETELTPDDSEFQQFVEDVEENYDDESNKLKYIRLTYHGVGLTNRRSVSTRKKDRTEWSCIRLSVDLRPLFPKRRKNGKVKENRYNKRNLY